MPVKSIVVPDVVATVVPRVNPLGKFVRLAPDIAGKVPVKLAAGKLVKEAPLPLNGLSKVTLPVPSGVVMFDTLTVLTINFFLYTIVQLEPLVTTIL
jgi:hypothetical protein